MSDKLSFVQQKYYNFIKKSKYIPVRFSPYNSTEVFDVAPTLTTYCGNISDSGAVCILVNSGGGQLLSDKLDLPCIVASRGRNPENPSSRKTGIDTEQ